MVKLLVFDIDEEKAKEYGLSTGYIGFTIRKLLDGEVATTINENGELIDYYFSITSPTSSKIKKHL